MPIERLSDATVTLYAELLDQLRVAPPLPRSGSFVSKTISGATYWYVQRVDGGFRRQVYLGPETESLVARIREAEASRDAFAEDERRHREIVAMLAVGRMATESAAVGSVIRVLADGGLFRAGAVLVGTQAFSAIANLLGVRFDSQSLRTADVDVGQPAISVAAGEMRTDILDQLRAADPRFCAVPELDPRQPSSSFKVRGRDLRVDLLTPGREGAKPVFLRHINAAALPVPGLDYLIQDAIPAAILTGAGILTNVPSPSRFALHKLWVSRRRNASEQAKARKDLRQAAQVLEVLLDDRPGDLSLAWSGLHPSMRKLVRSAAGTLDADLRARLGAAVQDAALSRR
jgi:hypothetical protein